MDVVAPPYNAPAIAWHMRGCTRNTAASFLSSAAPPRPTIDRGRRGRRRRGQDERRNRPRQARGLHSRKAIDRKTRAAIAPRAVRSGGDNRDLPEFYGNPSEEPWGDSLSNDLAWVGPQAPPQEPVGRHPATGGRGMNVEHAPLLPTAGHSRDCGLDLLVANTRAPGMVDHDETVGERLEGPPQDRRRRKPSGAERQPPIDHELVACDEIGLVAGQ